MGVVLQWPALNSDQTRQKQTCALHGDWVTPWECHAAMLSTSSDFEFHCNVSFSITTIISWKYSYSLIYQAQHKKTMLALPMPSTLQWVGISFYWHWAYRNPTDVTQTILGLFRIEGSSIQQHFPVFFEACWRFCGILHLRSLSSWSQHFTSLG